MTKRQLVRELRDVIDGTSGHNVAQVWKTGRSWNMDTNISRNAFEYNEDSRIFDHCCNKITLKEVEQELNKAFGYYK